MSEFTPPHPYLTRIAHGDGADGTFYPGLILQPFIPRQTLMFLDFIGIDERKTTL